MRGDNRTADLFQLELLPQGLKYQPGFLSSAEEGALLRHVPSLPLKEFEFHGFTGKRRTVSFGWRYDFNSGGLTDFLTELRVRAEDFAGISAGRFNQVLVTGYAPGAGIGWHKDRSVFGDVLGLSLLSSCTFRLRRRADKSFERYSLKAEPGSVYLLRGPSRAEWEHSIPPVESLRYSITFRSLLEGGA